MIVRVSALAAAFCPASLLRRRRIEHRIRIEMGRDEVRLTVQDAMQRLIALHIEDRPPRRAPPGIDMAAHAARFVPGHPAK